MLDEARCGDETQRQVSLYECAKFAVYPGMGSIVSYNPG